MWLNVWGVKLPLPGLYKVREGRKLDFKKKNLSLFSNIYVLLIGLYTCIRLSKGVNWILKKNLNIFKYLFFCLEVYTFNI